MSDHVLNEKILEQIRQGSGSSTQELTSCVLSSLREVTLRRLDLGEDARKFGWVLPGLTSLNINGCGLRSLRDIGALSGLTVLAVGDVGLGGLEGISSCTLLQELYAPFNSITDITQAAGLGALEVLDLEGNGLNTVCDVQCLRECGALRHLTLVGNPLDRTESYRGGVGHLLPELLTLDDNDVAEDVAATDAYPFTESTSLPVPCELPIKCLVDMLKDMDVGLPSEERDDPTSKLLEAKGEVVDMHLLYSRMRETTGGWVSASGTTLTAVGGKAQPALSSSSALTVGNREAMCGRLASRTMKRVKREKYSPVVASALYPYPFNRQVHQIRGCWEEAKECPV